MELTAIHHPTWRAVKGASRATYRETPIGDGTMKEHELREAKVPFAVISKHGFGVSVITGYLNNPPGGWPQGGLADLIMGHCPVACFEGGGWVLVSDLLLYFELLSVDTYIREEVRRQGHNIQQADGLMRIQWMTAAWNFARERAVTPLEIGGDTIRSHSLGSLHRKPTINDALHIGKLIEPEKNKFGCRTIPVRVGPRIPPAPEEVQPLLTKLWLDRDRLPPIRFYYEFEMIHPFQDGNGRAGKVLLNWLNGSLENPIFPPADLFGYPIANP